MPKTDVHPQYFPAATITCTCGATYAMGSTKDALRVDLCSTCHPFYSGNQKLIDTAGRVDRFREKMATAETMQSKAKKTAKAEAPKAEVSSSAKALDDKEVTEAPAEEVVEAGKSAAEEIEPTETPSEEGSEENTDAAADSDAGKEA